MELVSSLSNNGYTVHTDNYYSSPALFLDLKQKGFEVCRTVIEDRKGLNETFKSITLSKDNNTNKLTIKYLTTV